MSSATAQMARQAGDGKNAGIGSRTAAAGIDRPAASRWSRLLVVLVLVGLAASVVTFAIRDPVAVAARPGGRASSALLGQVVQESRCQRRGGALRGGHGRVRRIGRGLPVHRHAVQTHLASTLAATACRPGHRCTGPWGPEPRSGRSASNPSFGGKRVVLATDRGRHSAGVRRRVAMMRWSHRVVGLHPGRVLVARRWWPDAQCGAQGGWGVDRQRAAVGRCDHRDVVRRERTDRASGWARASSSRASAKPNFQCQQLGRQFGGKLVTQGTPNPNFRRIDAVVTDAQAMC